MRRYSDEEIAALARRYGFDSTHAPKPTTVSSIKVPSISLLFGIAYLLFLVIDSIFEYSRGYGIAEHKNTAGNSPDKKASCDAINLKLRLDKQELRDRRLNRLADEMWLKNKKEKKHLEEASGHEEGKKKNKTKKETKETKARLIREAGVWDGKRVRIPGNDGEQEDEIVPESDVPSDGEDGLVVTDWHYVATEDFKEGSMSFTPEQV